MNVDDVEVPMRGAALSGESEVVKLNIWQVMEGNG